jgi:glutathione synthase/RimK-type ligase-like ATP-grasp enzyme
VIAVWGLPTDAQTAAVIHALEQRGECVRLIDQREVLATAVQLSATDPAAGRVVGPSSDVDLADVTAVFARPQDVTGLPWVTTEEQRATALQVTELLAVWVELTTAFVVNRPSRGASNGSKPRQLGVLRECGFDVPETLVTSSPDAARTFRARHGSVAVKSISAWRSRVRRRSDDEGLDRVGSCPVQLQEWVPGQDVRVHVVGDELFACDVMGDGGDDYRFGAVQGRSRELPADVAVRCRAVARELGLPLVGIDLRATPEGRWVCFEANPAPAFDFYSRLTGQPIAEAVAALLVTSVH